MLLLNFLFIHATPNDRINIDLSGSGWYLWQDKDALWQNETVVLSFDDALGLSIAEPTSGWGILTSSDALMVNVPGTAEEYLQTNSGVEGDIKGVTWWSRRLDIPKFHGKKKVVLKFGSIRSRAEVFINRRLVGYQIVDNVPFEIDITSYIKPGATAELSVRITDAGGNHDWRDSKTIPWGEIMLPPGHAFGGITGNVSLEIINPVYVSDVYMQNTPALTTVNAVLTLMNESAHKVKKDLQITVSEYAKEDSIIYSNFIESVSLDKGENEFVVPITASHAKLWSVESPNLYVCKVELLNDNNIEDGTTKRFGFRWFEADGTGENAVFRLNGKRIVLRSAISWGFWPVNGIYPSNEMAERQVHIAKKLGLNMLNFHRFMGNPNVLDYADELGLLYFEEPGGFRLDVNQPFMNAVLHQKVLSMVKRDRSHPSLVIYNMMNESGDAAIDKLELEVQAMKDMAKLDPSRYILRTSAWAKADDIDDQAKIHIRPYDSTIYWNGWYDYHRAGGPAVWNEDLYKSPVDYYNNTSNYKEIVFFGEEGALSAPPRLLKNKKDLDKLSYLGWDGREFLKWYDEFDTYLDKKALRTTYSTVDDLCIAMGAVSYEHQGRKIESARINNVTDAYVVNGWESELTENYSGIVDCFRYPKSHPELISRYNEPLYVAVKTRNQIAAAGDSIIVDFYIVNEENICGDHTLHIFITSPNGIKKQLYSFPVSILGEEVYGQLLIENVTINLPNEGGMCRIDAKLMKEDVLITSGYDDVLSVDLAANNLKGYGAVWEDGRALQNFLSERTQHPVEAYSDDCKRLDWIFVVRPPKQEQLTMIPTEALRSVSGEYGIDVVYYEDMNFEHEVYREIGKVVNLSAIEGATPSPFVHMLAQYGIVWSGSVIPPVSGEYTFKPQSNDRSMIELWVDGNKIYEVTDKREHQGDGKIYLSAGQLAKIEIRFKHPRSNARCRLDWAVPNDHMPNPQLLLERAQRDGTKIFILQSVDEWAEFIQANSQARFHDKFYVGTNWLGGVMFNKPHRVFKQLPVGGALNWPYQALIHTGVERRGFVMEGEELLVGAYHSYPMALGTAMGFIPMGSGMILFSTLDIYGNIINDTRAGLVAKKIICNMIDL